jgi:ankyrin repeat protein
MTEEWQVATKRGDVPSVRWLLEHGADINARDGQNQTALMNAVMAGDSALVQFLVEQGAELDTTAKYNLSALMLAIIRGQTAIAQLLIEAEADVNIRSSPGLGSRPALVLAKEREQHEIVDLLVRIGAME